jgi:hypothetical protein
MSSIEISESEASALAYALQKHVTAMDRLLGGNACWPSERNKLLQLFTKLKRAALPIAPDDADDDWRVYEFY